MNSTTSMPRAALIEDSLQQVADRIGDPAVLIYRRLFELAPEVEPLFVADRSGNVRAEMLHRALDAIMDLVGDGRFATGLFHSEFVNHQQIGVHADAFDLFIVAMIDTFRATLGPDWTEGHEQAWRSVRTEIGRIVDGTR